MENKTKNEYELIDFGIFSNYLRNIEPKFESPRHFLFIQNKNHDYLGRKVLDEYFKNFENKTKIYKFFENLSVA